MNKFFALISATLLSLNLMAQAPQKMSYQAVIRNSSDALVANQQIGMKVSILKDSENSVSVYSETHTTTTNQNGLVAIAIGGGNVLSGDFSKINWGSGVYFVKTETDIKGGTNYSVTGTSQLLSVPYALSTNSSNNGIQRVSDLGDSLILTDGKAIIIPSISTWNNQKSFGVSDVDLTDVDGNIYKTVKIGNQIWMAENLRTSKYNDGTIIPNNKNVSNQQGAWFWKNDSSIYNIPYGKVYNIFVVPQWSKKNVCPIGWHLPLTTEISTLINFLGAESAGAKIKQKGTHYWITSNYLASNSSLFNGIPSQLSNGSSATWLVQNSQGAFTVRANTNSIEPYSSVPSQSGSGGEIRCIKD
jgi:uncharacterized protein (TIGR02145 family)